MLIELLARMWAVNNDLPQRADLIVPVAYGATKTGPTNGAIVVAMRTLEILTYYKNRPLLYYGVFTGSPDPKIEQDFKSKMFPRKVSVGTVVSTIEECLKVKKVLPLGSEPKTIILVTDEGHSRRARIVWETFFPSSNILIVSVPLSETIDRESPMTSYRSAWKAFLFQVLPTPFFWYLAKRGPKFMARFATRLRQPIGK